MPPPKKAPKGSLVAGARQSAGELKKKFAAGLREYRGPPIIGSHLAHTQMTNLLPWEAPSVSDIDLADNTHGGGTIFSDESTFGVTTYNFTPDGGS